MLSRRSGSPRSDRPPSRWAAPSRSTRPGSPRRLAAVNDGFEQIEEGADQLRDGPREGLDKLRAARWLLERTGVPVPGPGEPADPNAERGQGDPRGARATGSPRAGTFLLERQPRLGLPRAGRSRPRPPPAATPAPEKPDPTVEQLARAVDGAAQIADGIRRASEEIAAILDDPVGRRSLDRLLITPETVRDHPELRESFDTYITPDGKAARFDVTQAGGCSRPRRWTRW